MNYSDGWGCTCTDTMCVPIVISDTGSNCQASFCYTASIDTSGMMYAVFYNTSTADDAITGVYWDYNDGLEDTTYTEVEHYWIVPVPNQLTKLYIQTANGCQSYFVDTIIIGNSCDSVWPGDANQDGIVNVLDVLQIGIGYNEKGISRTNASSNWEAQYTEDWQKWFANSVNYKHADCNGDGIINIGDTSAIKLNYSKTHGTSSGNQFTSATDTILLYFDINKDTLFNKESVRIPIMLGTDTMMASDIYGITFSIDYDPLYIDTSTIKLDFNTSWLGDITDTSLIAISIHLTDSSMIDVGIVRTDHENISGFGEIGGLSFIVIDNIDGKRTAAKKLKLSFMNVFVVDSIGNAINIKALADSVSLLQSALRDHILLDNHVRIYPNPNSGKFNVEIETIGNTELQISLSNISGQVIFSENITGLSYNSQIDLTDHAKGIYTLKLISDAEVISRKVVYR